MCKRKWNNRCFVIASFSVPMWKQRMYNMEQRVESRPFVARMLGVDYDTGFRFDAVSARTVLDGCESDFKRRFKLRRAIRRCSTVYVLENAFSDMEASMLYEYAERKGKRIVHEEDFL